MSEAGLIEYVPLGEQSPIKLTIPIVMQNIATPTKQGHQPTHQDVIKFMMLCQARRLNPWVGDAWLLGYDTRDGPKFELITSHQALLKRAEANANFDGMQSGVIVKRKGQPDYLELEGDLVPEGDILVGGWAKVYRKDRQHAATATLDVKVYDTQKARWNVDKAGMIVKCAESHALREAFPSDLGGMYSSEEMQHVDHEPTKPKQVSVSALNEIDERKEDAGAPEGTRLGGAPAPVFSDEQVDEMVEAANQRLDEILPDEETPLVWFARQVRECKTKRELDELWAGNGHLFDDPDDVRQCELWLQAQESQIDKQPDPAQKGLPI